MRPHIALISLGVKDFERAKRFYNEGLGWPIQQEQGDWACFSLGDDGSSALTLYPWDDFAVEAGLRPDGGGFRGVAFAYNVHSEERVDEVIAEAERAGATITKPPKRTPWGGYSAYFTDPEGHLWEVATGASSLPFSE